MANDIRMESICAMMVCAAFASTVLPGESEPHELQIRYIGFQTKLGRKPCESPTLCQESPSTLEKITADPAPRPIDRQAKCSCFVCSTSADCYD